MVMSFGGPGNVTEPVEGHRRAKVLHLLVEASEEEFAYNELCLARASTHDMGVCTLLKSKVQVPETLRLYQGDGSVRGFLSCLRKALSDATYDVIHAHSPHVASLLLLSKLVPPTSPPAVFTVQHSYTNSNLNARNRLLDLLAFATFDRTVLVSEAARDSFPSIYRRLAGQRLCVVPHAADLARIDRTIKGSGDEALQSGFTVASVGRLIPIKNPETLLEAFLQERSPDATLVLIGEGQLAGSLTRRAREAEAVESVRLTGLMPRDDVYRSLWAADLFVSASLGEGMPVAVLEAMACRCPVALSDIPSHREIAADADFIPLFPPKDPNALARQISRFRQMSNAMRREIGRRCRELVEDRYSLSTIHGRYDAIYRDLSYTPPPPG